MALTGEELVDEIQALTGRTGDVVLIDDTRCTRWLNEAQKDIIDKCPGLNGLDTIVADATLLYCISDSATYDFGDFSNRVAHILDVYYINGTDSHKMDYMPEDEFFDKYIDYTSTDYTPQKPVKYTRINDTFRIAPWPDGDWAAQNSGDMTGIFRMHYTRYAGDFTTNDSNSSEIPNADEGLIFWGVAKAWGAMGQEEKRVLWDNKYKNWLSDYKQKNDMMTEWDGDVIFDR